MAQNPAKPRLALATDVPTRRSVLALVASLLGCAAGAAADWPQWRGPDRNGLVPRGISLVHVLVGQTPLWESEPIPSGERGGRGSLAVYADKVFGLTSMPSGQQSYAEVFCLDAKDGSTLWRSRLSEASAAEPGSATPCVFDGRLYVAGAGTNVHCLNSETGVTLWQRELLRQERKPMASSICIADGVAVLLADVLTGLDPRSGDVLWRQEQITGYESSPALWRTSEGEYVICNSRLQTHCVDPASGQLLWNVPGGGRSSPVVVQEYGGDFLVNMSSSRKNGISAYRLRPRDPVKLWTVRAFDRAASPVVYDGHVYAVAGGSNGHGAHVLCIHLDTGLVAWDEIIDFAEVSSPLVADGKLVAVCGTSLRLFQATPEKFSVLSQADYRITLCTSPAIRDGRLYLRQSGAVVCYDLRAEP